MHTRWITVGIVREHYLFHRGWGCPGAIEINLSGRRWGNYTWNFFSWDQMFWALRRRIELGGLELVAVASRAKRDYMGHIFLCALVRREATPRYQPSPALRLAQN